MDFMYVVPQVGQMWEIIGWGFIAMSGLVFARTMYRVLRGA